jgi:hypothetical protein
MSGAVSLSEPLLLLLSLLNIQSPLADWLLLGSLGRTKNAHTLQTAWRDTIPPVISRKWRGVTKRANWRAKRRKGGGRVRKRRRIKVKGRGVRKMSEKTAEGAPEEGIRAATGKMTQTSLSISEFKTEHWTMKLLLTVMEGQERLRRNQVSGSVLLVSFDCYSSRR